MIPIGVPGVYAVSVILPVLATAAVVARFHVRRLKKVAYKADDWLSLAALVSLTT